VTTRKSILAAMATGLTVRLAVIPFLYTEWTDPFVVEHWAFGRIARSLAQGHGFGSPFADTGTSALLPPVYAGRLSLIFRVFGSNTVSAVVAAAALNSVLSVLMCVPMYWIARRCFGTDRDGRWAAWAWALSPYGIYYSADWLWSTCLFTLLLLCLFLASIDLEASDSPGRWLAFGAAAGITALTEPVALAVVPFLALVSVWRLFRARRRWLLPAICAAGACVAAMSPWIVRNYRIFHDFIPVRDGYGLELYLGNNGYTEHWANRSVHPNHNDAELAEYSQTGEIAYMNHKRDQAMTWIEAHPATFLWLTARRVVYMWTGFWSADSKYLNEEPLDPPNWFMATSMTVLAWIGLRRAFRESNPQAVRFALPLFFFPLAYYVSHPETYYLRPLDPLVVLLAVFAVTGWIKPRALNA